MPLRIFCAALVCCVAVPSALAASASLAPVNYDEAKVPRYTLPDPLALADGGRVTDAATWRTRRRPELLEIFAREVYGRTPTGRPAGMHWAVTAQDRAALGGKAVRKEITIWFSARKDGPKMHLVLYQPAGDAGAHTPWPAFLGLGFRNNHSAHADPGITLHDEPPVRQTSTGEPKQVPPPDARGATAERWAIEAVLARGYATAFANYTDIVRDRVDGLHREAGSLFGTRPVEERAGDEWGSIGIWAWGLSRALDYLESDPEIDGKRVAVHGHSRLGKTALWAGAQDERFALVISNNSGCGGAALSRRRFGETVGRINQSFPHWFARNFRRYNEREDALPVDQHELIAVIAPRPVYVASAEQDKWADPRGEFLGAKHAEPVYALFGRRGLGVTEMPAVNRPVLGDGLAYHIRSGKHDITSYDWAQYLDFADKMLKR